MEYNCYNCSVIQEKCSYCLQCEEDLLFTLKNQKPKLICNLCKKYSKKCEFCLVLGSEIEYNDEVIKAMLATGTDEELKRFGIFISKN